ncbi:MAG: radical SAM protein [Candidatus Omnitrophica bacterium]|nr:radical SAM protein [Candidatus Omnitrophota bacterium]
MIQTQNLLLRTFGRAKPGSRLQSIIQKFSKQFVGGYPYVIKLDVIDICNLNCKMCYTKNSGHDVPFSNLLHIFRQIGNIPVRLDLLGGEPLLREDICEVIKFAKSHTAIRKVVIYTNGTLATEKLARKLARAGLDKAIVTFISHNLEKHDTFTRVADSWNKTVNGIKNFVQAGIKTYTFTALHSENITDLENIHKFVRNQLKITPLFYQYVPQSQNDPLLISSEVWAGAKHKVLYNFSPKHFDYLQHIITFCGRLCLGGYYVISIKTDGTVNPCPFIYDIPLGNVFEQNLWDIFARRYKSDEFCEFMSLPEECTSCSYKNLCGGGCKAGNKILYGNYINKDCRCLGPWSEVISLREVRDKLPTFF